MVKQPKLYTKNLKCLAHIETNAFWVIYDLLREFVPWVYSLSMSMFVAYVDPVWPPFAPIIFGSWPETPVAEISDEERLVSLWRRNTKRWEFGKWEFFFGQIMWNHTSWSSRCHIAIVMRMRKKQTAWDTEIFTTCQAWVYPSLWRQVGTRTGRDIFKHLHYFKMSFNIFMRKFHQIRGLNLLQPLWNPRLFSKWHFQILIWQDKNLVEKLVHDFAVENWVLKFSGKKGLRHLERLAGWTFWGAAGLLHSLTAQNRMISIPNSAHVLRWDMMIWSLWFLW